MPSGYRRKSRKRSKGDVAGQLKRRAKRRGARLRQIVGLLKQAGCSRCPERHPACLEFHHRDPSTKIKSGRAGCIAEMVGRGVSLDVLLAEIAKCDLLCSNCHRKHHAASRGQ